MFCVLFIDAILEKIRESGFKVAMQKEMQLTERWQKTSTENTKDRTTLSNSLQTCQGIQILCSVIFERF
jgi:hypothetical protein